MNPDALHDIETLTALMARLPGLGPRSARRAVLALLKKRTALMVPLAEVMARTALNAKECSLCGNISTDPLCPICTDPRRATHEICVVEDVADLWAIERAGGFHGRYHVLGGTLSPLDAVGPDELRIPDLVARVKNEAVSEIILALNATVDGQTTSYYIADELAGCGARISTLAQGVPIGGELNYLDDGTIGAAMRARRQL